MISPDGRRVEVVCLGETMALLTPDPVRPLRDAETMRLSHGGAESNVAVSLAHLGDRVAWCSRLGADPLGDRVLADLAGHGVDVSAVVRDPRARTGLYLKDPAPGGTSVWYYRDGSAAACMDRGDVERALALSPRVLHLSGITAALSACCADLVEYALDAARAAGVTTSFDVNYRPRLWPDPARAAAALLPLARRSDVVFVGRDEAEALWGTPSAQDVRALIAPPAWLVVKDGAVGATAFGGAAEGTGGAERAVHEPALAVDVVEPVGAGDAFAAGWLHAMLHGLRTDERLRLGHLVAAISLRSPTDHGVFPDDPRSLEALARRREEGVPS